MALPRRRQTIEIIYSRFQKLAENLFLLEDDVDALHADLVEKDAAMHWRRRSRIGATEKCL